MDSPVYFSRLSSLHNAFLISGNRYLMCVSPHCFRSGWKIRDEMRLSVNIFSKSYTVQFMVFFRTLSNNSITFPKLIALDHHNIARIPNQQEVKTIILVAICIQNTVLLILVQQLYIASIEVTSPAGRC